MWKFPFKEIQGSKIRIKVLEANESDLLSNFAV